jgi:hypothetical protein
VVLAHRRPRSWWCGRTCLSPTVSEGKKEGPVNYRYWMRLDLIGGRSYLSLSCVTFVAVEPSNNSDIFTERVCCPHRAIANIPPAMGRGCRVTDLVREESSTWSY